MLWKQYRATNISTGQLRIAHSKLQTWQQSQSSTALAGRRAITRGTLASQSSLLCVHNLSVCLDIDVEEHFSFSHRLFSLEKQDSSTVGCHRVQGQLCGRLVAARRIAHDRRVAIVFVGLGELDCSMSRLVETALCNGPAEPE